MIIKLHHTHTQGNTMHNNTTSLLRAGIEIINDRWTGRTLPDSFDSYTPLTMEQMRADMVAHMSEQWPKQYEARPSKGFDMEMEYWLGLSDEQIEHIHELIMDVIHTWISDRWFEIVRRDEDTTFVSKRINELIEQHIEDNTND